MSFVGKTVTGIKYAGLGAVGFGLIQGAGELGKMSQSNSADTSFDGGANLIACYNAVELMGTGDSTFELSNGVIVGIDLVPADEGTPMYGTVACDEGDFERQLSTLPEERRMSSDDILEAGNTTTSIGVETESDDREGDYQMATFAVLAVGAAVKKRHSLTQGLRSRRQAKRERKAEIKARRNNPPRDPGDWSDTPC